MNLEEFTEDVRNTVNARAAVENDYTSMSFMAEIGERFAESGEVENLTVMQFEGTGSRNRKLAIHGFDLDDDDGSVALAVLLHSDSQEFVTVTAAEAKKRFAWLESFLSDALTGAFIGGREESSAAYQVAEDLRKRGGAVSRYRLYLVTNGRLSDRAKSFPSSTIGGVSVDYHLWDMRRLHQMHESQEGREALGIDLTHWMKDGLPVLKIGRETSDFATYLAAVPAAVVAELYGQHGSRLLEGNVRSFLSGRGKVNKGIKSTILAEPEMFLAYNNGITATATGVTLSSDGQRATSLMDLQIVNGGQTTASLFYVAREAGNARLLDDVFVPMKLVVVEPEPAVDLVPKISRYANSQNRVSEVDFFSNSPFHVRLEALSRRLLAPAMPGSTYQTKGYYERTRGQYLNERNKLGAVDAAKFLATYPRAQVITKTDMAKFVVSWEQKPHVVSSGAQKNFVVFAEGVTKIWQTTNDDINEGYFKDLVAKAIMFGEVRRLVSNADWYDRGYLANIVAYTLAKVSFEIGRQAPDQCFNFSAVWLQQALPEAMKKTFVEVAEKVASKLTSPQRRVANVTEWAKSPSCWDSVRDEPMALGPEFITQLVSASAQLDTKSATRAVQKIDNGIEVQTRMLSIPPEQWESVRQFAIEKRLVGPTDVGILDLVTRRKRGLPTERQCARLFAVLGKVEQNGYDRD